MMNDQSSYVEALRKLPYDQRVQTVLFDTRGSMANICFLMQTLHEMAQNDQLASTSNELPTSKLLEFIELVYRDSTKMQMTLEAMRKSFVPTPLFPISPALTTSEREKLYMDLYDLVGSISHIDAGIKFLEETSEPGAEPLKDEDRIKVIKLIHEASTQAIEQLSQIRASVLKGLTP
jgi:hypothetical protein